MPAATYNFLCEQGATLQRTLQYRNEAGDIINLTGATARMQVRAEVEATAIIIELTTANSRIVINGAQGEIDLIITAADTSALPLGNHYYDLELVQGTFVTRLIEGRFFVKAEVTR